MEAARSREKKSRCRGEPLAAPCARMRETGQASRGAERVRRELQQVEEQQDARWEMWRGELGGGGLSEEKDWRRRSQVACRRGKRASATPGSHIDSGNGWCAYDLRWRTPALQPSRWDSRRNFGLSPREGQNVGAWWRAESARWASLRNARMGCITVSPSLLMLGNSGEQCSCRWAAGQKGREAGKGRGKREWRTRRERKTR